MFPPLLWPCFPSQRRIGGSSPFRANRVMLCVLGDLPWLQAHSGCCSSWQFSPKQDGLKIVSWQR